MTTAHEGRRAAEEHLSEDELAAVADGAHGLPESRAGHAQRCARCRDALAAMDEVRSLLADLARPELPRDVAVRIDAALARESAARREEPAASAAGASRLRSRPRFARLAAWSVAALAVIGGGIATGAALLSSGSNAVTASGSSSGAASGEVPGERPQLNPDDESAGPNVGSFAPRNALPTALAPASLSAWAAQAAPAGGYGGVRVHAATLAPSVEQCLANPRFTGNIVLAVTTGTYANAPGALVVYADGDDPGAVYAVAYALPCTASRFSVVAEGVVSGLARSGG